jgi:hypothetical protein
MPISLCDQDECYAAVARLRGSAGIVGPIIVARDLEPWRQPGLIQHPVSSQAWSAPAVALPDSATTRTSLAASPLPIASERAISAGVYRCARSARTCSSSCWSSTARVLRHVPDSA